MFMFLHTEGLQCILYQIQFVKFIRQQYLLGTGPTTVFDLQNDVEVEDPVQLLSTPSYGDYEIYGSFNNDYSANPLTCWKG